MARRFATLDQLYRATLQEVLHDYEHENSPRGHAEREIIGFSARLDRPLSRHCLHPRRRQNIVFNYAEALWYLSGRNDLDFIAHYAPSIARYSADGLCLPGTGYGARLLHFGPQALNQIERAFDILRRDDPDSKRVFLQIFDASEDLYSRNIDVSCTLGLQLLLRQGKLHMVAFMRANDAYVGLLSDVFSFTFLQEYFASVLGCGVGSYSHHVGSLHIYDENLQSVEDLLADAGGVVVSDAPPPSMPAGCSAALVARVLGFEARIRSEDMDLDRLQALELDPYWRDILQLFWIYGEVRAGRDLPANALHGLHPLHRAFLINRWGDALPACRTRERSQ